jgi:hypothetical protein
MGTSYTVGFIINVIKYSNSIIGQLKDILFHPLLQNMLMEKARGRITEVKEEKTSFCTHIAKWSDLESSSNLPSHNIRYYTITTKLIGLNPADQKNVGPAGL